jgi:hypothetical protein
MKKLLFAFLILSIFLKPTGILAFTTNGGASTLTASSNHYWSIADASQTGLDFSADFTISAWVSMTSQPSLNSQMCIVCKFQPAGGQRQYQLYYEDTAGTKDLGLQIVTKAGSVNQTLSNSTVYMVTFVFTDSTDSAVIYVNGSSIGTVSGLTDAPVNTNEEFRVGKSNGGSGNFDATVDDVRVWSRALSGAEVSDLYQHPCTFSNGSSLQGEWYFDFATQGNDNSSNANNLTANNSVNANQTALYTCPAATSNTDVILFW